MILRKTKKIVTALLFTGVFGLASAVSVFAFTGSGTQAEPYLINDVSGLKELATAVNGGETYSGKYFELTSDLTMSGNWTPIGTGDNSFAGFFDGGNHTINNMVVNTDGVAGLFGTVSTGAQIAHLTLEGGSVTTSGTSAGGFVGKMLGTGDGKIVVYDCVNKSCSVSGTGSTCTDGIGGIVGYAKTDDNKGFAIVEYCKNYSDVYASSSDVKYVGGIAGSTVGSSAQPTIVRKCSNYGSIGYSGSTKKYGGTTGTGGISGAARNRSLVYNCANYGSIYGVVDATVGGICGRSLGSTTYVCKCYNKGVVSGSKYCGGISGYNTGGIISTYTAISISDTSNVFAVAGKHYYSSGGSIKHCYYNNGYIAYDGLNKAVISAVNSSRNVSYCAVASYADSVSDMNSDGLGNIQFSTYCSNFATDVSTLFVQNTIDLKLNNSGVESSLTVTEGDTYPLTPPTKTGYTFAGWYTTESGGMHCITDTDVVALSHENTEGRTLYARWTANASQTTKHTKADAAKLLKDLAKNGKITYNEEYDEDGNKVVDMRDIIDILKEA